MKPKAKHNQSSELSQFFQAMGMSVEREWRDAGYDAGRFPQIAAAALERSNAPRLIDPIDILRHLDTTPLTRQQDVEGRFSSLPLTLFSASRFYIDVYFWLDGTTAIHQHGFAGAFQVLSGSSLHSQFNFQTRREVSPYFKIGDLSLKEVQLLSQGDIQRIVAGKEYIHSLFHLDRPSTTITVRTVGLPTVQPQYSYLSPGIAFDPFFSDQAMVKKVQSVNVLLALNHPEADAFIKRILMTSDLHTTFEVLNASYAHLCGSSPEFGNLAGKQKRWESLVECVRKRHGRDADAIAKVLSESDRQMSVVERRNYVSNPDLRFFLALLLNLSGRKRILRLVKERYPGASAVETVLNWVEDLSRIKLARKDSNALGIDGFDDVDLLIIECMVNGKSLQETQANLLTIFHAEKPVPLRKKIKMRHGVIKRSPILKSLFMPD